MKKLVFLLLGLFLCQSAMSQVPHLDTLSFVRPLDATAYTAGDVIATSTTGASTYLFKIIGAGAGKGGAGVLVYLKARVDTGLTGGAIHCWFYSDSARASYVGDNAAYAGSDTAFSSFLGSQVLAFTGSGTASATYSIAEAQMFIPYVCSLTSQALWMRVTCESAFTPKNGGRFRFNIGELRY